MSLDFHFRSAPTPAILGLALGDAALAALAARLRLRLRLRVNGGGVMRRLVLVWLLMLIGCFWCRGAMGQDLPDGVRLGMGIAELRQALPGLDAVRRPQRLAGGLVGGWQLPAAQLVGLTGTQTFFFARGELRRVEFLADGVSDAEASAAFEALLEWGRRSFGVEQGALDARGRTGGWSNPSFDVYIRLVNSPKVGVQLVFNRRPPRDESVL